jgi:DNA-binding LytR/AlgR family response regulator
MKSPRSLPRTRESGIRKLFGGEPQAPPKGPGTWRAERSQNRQAKIYDRITAIIAEDGRSFARLKAAGKLWPELLLADVGDGEAALEAIAEHQPRLAFLDIQMPEMTGVEVAKSLAANREIKCHIVFVTAFDQYAVEAFDTGAIDYVLKPYSDERLATAIARLKERLGGSGAPAGAPQNLEALVAHLSAKLNPLAEKLKWIKANIGSNCA